MKVLGLCWRQIPNSTPHAPICKALGVITFLDPRSAPSAPIEPYTARRQIPAVGEPLRIGLMANGFPDSVAFLERVGESLRKRTPPDTIVVLHDKRNASALATDAQIEALACESHVVVTSYGH